MYHIATSDAPEHQRRLPPNSILIRTHPSKGLARPTSTPYHCLMNDSAITGVRRYPERGPRFVSRLRLLRASTTLAIDGMTSTSNAAGRHRPSNSGERHATTSGFEEVASSASIRWPTCYPVSIRPAAPTSSTSSSPSRAAHNTSLRQRRTFQSQHAFTQQCTPSEFSRSKQRARDAIRHIARELHGENRGTGLHPLCPQLHLILRRAFVRVVPPR